MGWNLGKMGREIIAECCYVVLLLLLHVTQGMVFSDHGNACLAGTKDH
jgi:hypothetical protein